MPESFRILLIADVGGDDTRHIGDEAMLQANLDAFRRLIPHAKLTVVSRNPEWVSSRYGVEAVPLFGFRRDGEADRREQLDRVLSTEARHGGATLDAVAAADAVVVSGGGNLSQTWPDLLYERVALLRLARRFGKPSAVLGQTIGPRLEGEERALLADALSDVRLLGVREIPSALLAVDLGVAPERLWYQCDDALLPGQPASSPQGQPTIAVTIDPQLRATSDKLFGLLADQLRTLAETTGAALCFIPHAFGSEDSGSPSDRIEGRLLAGRIGGGRMAVDEGRDARATQELTSSASLVISTRYHPVVFALAAGVPSLGIHGDDYCRIKLQGAYAHARIEEGTLTYGALARGELLPRALALFHERAEVRRRIEERHESWREEQRDRWTAIVRALGTDATPPSGRETLFGRPSAELIPALAEALVSQRRWSDEERVSLDARHGEIQRRLQEQLGPRQTIRRYAAALGARLWRR